MRENAELSLSELSTRTNIRVEELKDMELGNFHVLGWVFQLAKFYDKKIRIEFY